MRNQIQRGDNLTLPVPYDVGSGQGVLVGAIFGVAAIDAKQNEPCDVVTVGVFSLPKVEANTFSVGAACFWNDTTKLITTTATGNVRIGAAVEAAANPSLTVAVRLNGSF